MATDHILVVEDDPIISGLVTYLLKTGHSAVSAVDNALAALDLIDREPIDLIVLDLMLPGMDGLTLLTKLRQRSRVPVLILSAKGQVSDKVAALEMGADDYLSKPFDASELLARVQALLRRARGSAPAAPEGRLIVGNLEMDLVENVVRIAGGKPITLTPTEFRLLHWLARNAGRVLTRESLRDHVWGSQGAGMSNDVDVYIRRLRRKIERDPKHPRYVLTRRGLGYKLAIPEDQAMTTEDWPGPPLESGSHAPAASSQTDDHAGETEMAHAPPPGPTNRPDRPQE